MLSIIFNYRSRKKQSTNDAQKKKKYNYTQKKKKLHKKIKNKHTQHKHSYISKYALLNDRDEATLLQFRAAFEYTLDKETEMKEMKK